MKVKLFTIRSEEASSKKLGFETFTGSPNEYVEQYKDYLIIRWGNSQFVYDKNNKESEFPQVINTAKSIRLNCAKDQALEKIASVTLTPKIYKLGETVPQGKKIVYRYREHTAGNDFRVMTGPFVIENGYYGKEFINTKKEWRIFFCGNNLMGCTRWKQKEGLDNTCRSLWGYDFQKVPDKLRRETLKAKKALNLDVGCFDILEKEEKYYFLEANTATTIDSKYIEKFYKKYLLVLIKEKYPKFKLE